MISLGIDIGGTGCKCVAFRDTGEQIAMSYREYPTKPGEVNLNALALRESVFFVISDCVKKLDDAKQVAAITVSSFGFSDFSTSSFMRRSMYGFSTSCSFSSWLASFMSPKSAWNCARSSNRSGCKKFSSDHSSSVLFCA